MAIVERTGKDGVTRYTLDFRDCDGDRVREALGPCSKSHANKEHKRRLGEVAEGVYVNPRKADNSTFAQVAQRFVDEHKTASTYYQDNLREGRPIMEHFGEMTMRVIGETDLHEFAGKRAGQVGPSTVRKNLTVLGTFFRWAKRRGLISVNPAAKARALTVEEWKLIRGAMIEGPDRDIAEFALATGARLAEIARLRWADVDLRAGFAAFVQLKGGRESCERVALSRTARTILRRQSVAEYVFTDRRGRHFDERWRRLDVAHRFKAACRDAGVPWASFKALRTTFATWAEEAGVPVEATQKALGHADVRTTQRFYTRSQADRTRAAVEAVQGLTDTLVDTAARMTESAPKADLAK